MHLLECMCLSVYPRQRRGVFHGLSWGQPTWDPSWGVGSIHIKIAYFNKDLFIPAPILVGLADTADRARVLTSVAPLSGIRDMPMFHVLRPYVSDLPPVRMFSDVFYESRLDPRGRVEFPGDVLGKSIAD